MGWLKKNITPLLLFLGLLTLYIHNLSRSVYGGDVGDFVTAAYVRGVAHPPGYPFFTILSSLLISFPFQTPAFMVGLISACSGAIGIVLFYLIILELTKNKFLAVLTSLIVSFSYFFWFYSEIAEVFILHTCFILLLFYIGILYYKKPTTKKLVIFSFILGLSFTNHHTTALFLPSFFLLLMKGLKKQFFPLSIKSLRTLLFTVVAFLSAFAVYVYIPIAASHNPIINWDHVHDIPSFFHLLLRKDYGTLTAGVFHQPSLEQRIVILKSYTFEIISQLTIPVVFLCLIGMIALFKKNTIIFFSFLLGFLFSGPIFITYAGFPLYGPFFSGVYERFLLVSSVVIIFFFPFGLQFITDGLANIIGSKKWNTLIQGIFLLIPCMLFIYNFPKTNLSNIFIGDNLAYDLLNPLPKNSILFINGDTALFNTWYVHYVLHVRPDVRLININSLGGDEYFTKIIASVQKNSQYKKDQTENIITTIKEMNKTHDVFSIEEINAPQNGLQWVPYGLTFRLLKSDEQKPSKEEFYQQSSMIWQQLQVPLFKDKQSIKALGNLSIADIPNYYANAAIIHANYVLSEYKDVEQGKKWLQTTLAIDPKYAKAYQVYGVIYLSLEKNCSLAADSLEKAITTDPFQKIAYFLLYATYKDCLQDKQKANEIITIFTNRFHENFLKEIKKTLQESKK